MNLAFYATPFIYNQSEVKLITSPYFQHAIKYMELFQPLLNVRQNVQPFYGTEY